MHKHILTAVACAALSLSAAMAAPDDHNRGDAMRGDAMHGGMHNDRGRDDHDMRNNHDRYWQPHYRGFVAQDRIFQALRGHGYARFNGAPYWFQGRYVVKSFDRRGRPVFIEVNPYTGDFVGVVRF